MPKYKNISYNFFLFMLLIGILLVSCGALVDSNPPANPPNNFVATPNVFADSAFVTFTWDPVDGADSYNIYWSTNSGVSLISNKIEGILSPHNYNSIQIGKTYYYRINAENSAGTSKLSNEIIAHIKKKLNIPTGVTVVAGDKKVTLSWNDVIDASHYSIFWSNTNNVTINSNPLQNVTSPYDHTNLINGQIYYYKVLAFNINSKDSSNLSSSVKATPISILLPPTNITGEPGDGFVTLNWDISPNVKYHIYWNNQGNVTTNDNRIAEKIPPYKHSNLTNGTTYYYKISSFNSSEESALSEEINVVPTNLTVLPPEEIIAIPGNQKITLRWNVTSNTSYNIYWAKDSGVNKINSDKFINVTSPYEHTSLINDSAYYYRVAAVKDTVESELSIEVKAIPSDSIQPEPPINIKAVPGNGRVEVTWDSVISATSYNIYWANQPNISLNSNKIKNVENPFIHLNLINDTPYYYRVTALNNSGESQLSVEVTATPVNVTTPPLPPENIKVTPGNKLVDITWPDVVNATSYNIYWANEANITISNSTKLEGVSSPYKHQNLTNGKDYYYRLSAKNAVGESDLSSEFKATPFSNNPPPDIPANVEATPENKMIILDWDKVTNASFYNIYWSTKPNVTTTNSTKVSNITPKHYDHQNLTNGTTYYYRVSAENDDGEGKLSDEVYAKPFDPDLPPEPPSHVSAKGGNKRVDLKWDKVPNAKFYNIYWGLKNTTPRKISNVLNNFYPHFERKKNTVYYYRISAVNAQEEEGKKSKLVQAKTN